MSKEKDFDKQDKIPKQVPLVEKTTQNASPITAGLQGGMGTTALPPSPPGGATIQRQAARLNDTRFSVTQRQQMANQMTSFGNTNMGQIIQTKGEDTNLAQSSFIQRNPGGYAWAHGDMTSEQKENYFSGANDAVDNPDYYVIEVGADLLGIVGGGVTVAITKNGSIYIAYGESFGGGDPIPLSVRLAGGKFISAGTDAEAGDRVHNFLTGTASSICVEGISSVCIVQAHGGETAIETGISLNAGVGVGASHTLFYANIPDVLSSIKSALQHLIEVGGDYENYEHFFTPL